MAGSRGLRTAGLATAATVRGWAGPREPRPPGLLRASAPLGAASRPWRPRDHTPGSCSTGAAWKHGHSRPPVVTARCDCVHTTSARKRHPQKAQPAAPRAASTHTSESHLKGTVTKRSTQHGSLSDMETQHEPKLLLRFRKNAQYFQAEESGQKYLGFHCSLLLLSTL